VPASRSRRQGAIFLGIRRRAFSTLQADDRPPCSRLATALVAVKVAPSGLAAVAESDVAHAA
jgi:hypothetical protein